jgi:glucuronate isomerase
LTKKRQFKLLGTTKKGIKYIFWSNKIFYLTLFCISAPTMALNPFSEEQIIARLQFENPWWATDSLDGYYQSFKPRLYFNLFYPLVKNTTVHRASVLMGPRRVGKTVMLSMLEKTH